MWGPTLGLGFGGGGGWFFGCFFVVLVGGIFEHAFGKDSPHSLFLLLGPPCLCRYSCFCDLGITDQFSGVRGFRRWSLRFAVY